MHYTKMHGAGNSFVIAELPHGEPKGGDCGVLALRLCREKQTDGLILVSPSADGDGLGMLFYNADGSAGEMCGNGARCLARWAVEHGRAPDPERIRICAAAGEVTGRRITQTLYEVRLNDPSVIDLSRSVPLDGTTVPCAYVELGEPGIPHAVVEVPESAFSAPDALRERGRALRFSPVFPRGANVSFVHRLSETRVRAITYERGVEDFTLACGTGCGAIAVSLRRSGKLPGGRLEIEMPGGTLCVSLREENGSIFDLLLTGPTAVVEEGKFGF